MLQKLRKKAYEVLEPEEKTTLLSRIIDNSLIILIVLNIAAVILESVPAYKEKYQTFFSYFEYISIIIFSIEYVFRVWVSIENNNVISPTFKTRIKYIFSPLGLLDLLAILPFYLPQIVGIDFRFMKLFRLLRVFRLFNLLRFKEELGVFSRVFKNKKIDIIIGLSFTLLLLLFVSTLMYFIENKAQPDAFKSIPDALWWGVATITTVGYGDVTPITPLGKLLGGITAIIGFALFAVPAGIFASGFTEEINKVKKKGSKVVHSDKCPHCHKPIHFEDLK